MQRNYIISVLILTLCGFLTLTSCGGSSTGSDNGNGGGPGSGEPPAAPANLSGTSGDQEIELNWDANDEDDLSGYNLYRSTSSFSDASDMDPVNGSELVTSPNFTDTGLENGTTYYYRITAVDEGNNESSVSTQLEITPFSGPPDRP